MPLKLSVPPPQEQSHALDLRPKQVQDWLASLPMANFLEAANMLAERLGALNRHKELGEDLRLKLLESYRVAIYQLLPTLEEKYSGLPLPLPEKSRQLAHLARQLYIELAYGYKIVLLAFIEKRVSKQMPMVVQRAIEALAGILIVCYQTYAPTPAGIWSEIHLLFISAAQQNIQDEQIIDNETGMASEATINLTYKQALLLALADPYRLMQGEVTRVMAYLRQFAHHAHLQPLMKTENPVGFFVVRLDGDKPPRAISQNISETDARTDILLNTIELARVLHQQVLKLEAGESPRNLQLPDSAKDPGYHDLLRRLIRHWGIAPKRSFNRMRKSAITEIFSGLRAIHYFLNGERNYTASEVAEDTGITLQFANSPIDKASMQTFSCSRWLMLNESAGGLGLSSDPTTPAPVRVGDLIGMRPEKSEDISLGVIRWVHSQGANRVELGAQMLSPNALPIALKPTIGPPDAKFSVALLLPEIPSLSQPAAIIAAPGTYMHQREFLMEENGETHTIRAQKRVEQTLSFEIFQFSSS